MHKVTKQSNTLIELQDQMQHIHQQMHYLNQSPTTSDEDKKTLNEYYTNKLKELEQKRDQRIKDLEVIEPILITPEEPITKDSGD